MRCQTLARLGKLGLHRAEGSGNGRSISLRDKTQPSKAGEVEHPLRHRTNTGHADDPIGEFVPLLQMAVPRTYAFSCFG